MTDAKRSATLLGSRTNLDRDSTFLHGCCHAWLAGMAEKPGAGMSAADHASESTEAMKLLEKAVSMGFRNPARYRNEVSLKSLHSRPDFEALMKRLEAPVQPAQGEQTAK
jgi:hypothetical protein